MQRILAQTTRVASRLTRAAATQLHPPYTALPALASPAIFRAPLSRSFANDSTHYRQPTSRTASGTDYYALLEVHRHALDAGDLKAAYYRLAKQYHPDAIVHLSPSVREAAAKKFSQIGVAYSVLSDPSKRATYDIFLDLSAIGDQDRMLHWVAIHRPPDQLGFEGFVAAHQQKQQQQQQTTATENAQPASGVPAEQTSGTAPAAPAAPASPRKPKVVLPVFRSS